jgi:2-polyprenyl-6-methoxyphenol hydroxylase-like FAD-dependent oxidoreductase
VAALALGRLGRRVLVLEANPTACKRLAGEWLHPPAVRVLRDLGVALPGNGRPWPTGEGFAVFPEDGTAPIVLPYVGGGAGLGLEHERLVKALREAVADNPAITFVPWARVAEVRDGAVSWIVRGGGAETAKVERVIGADGRGSVVRASLALPSDSFTPSRMAGVLLKGATLPEEGFGHVFLGGPGPILGYRIGEDDIRLCVDVPQGAFDRGDRAGLLREGYTRALPEGLRAAFHAALEANRVQWAANQVRPRLDYGTASRTLLGDAVGHYHPLTALGMSLGFIDAATLAAARDFSGWRDARLRDARVPELLAVGLYDVFAEHTDLASAMRQAVYRTWRTDPGECRRTMRYLACEDTRVGAFGWSFTTTLARAGVPVLWQTARRRGVRPTARMTRDLGVRVSWIVAGALRLGSPANLPSTTAAVGVRT